VVSYLSDSPQNAKNKMLYKIITAKWLQTISWPQKIKRFTREILNKGTFVVNL